MSTIVDEAPQSTVVGEALHRDDNVSGMPPAVAPAVSVFAQVHPLPRAEGELAVRDGDVYRRPNKSALKSGSMIAPTGRGS